MQAFNLHYLRNLRPEWRQHPLFEDDYIIHFLIQHNSQHYETMVMVLTQKALRRIPAGRHHAAPLQAHRLRSDSVDIPAGHYRVGGEPPGCL